MRASKEGGNAASSIGGGSSWDAAAFPFPLPTVDTTLGDVSHGLPLSLYLLKGWGKVAAPQHHHRVARQDIVHPEMW